MNFTMDDKKTYVSFLAIDQFVESNLVKPIEIEPKDKDFVAWGEMNNYPDYLMSLYEDVPILKSLVDGVTDYICGDGIITDWALTGKVNKKGDTLYDIIRMIAFDLALYNGFALNIIKNKFGGVAEIWHLDFSKVRSNKDNNIFFYSNDWSKSYGRVKYIKYNAYDSDGTEPSTIFYYKKYNNHIYPTPIWAAAATACEIEKKMNEYHLNNISNSFSSNYIVNFNGGRPTDEIKEQIEEEFYDKFTGVENAGRPMLVFNNSKEEETTIVKVDADNFIDRYTTLAQRTREQIFLAFRATPNLFGIPTETTGFNTQEYTSSFKLFNKTVVKPFQDGIISSMGKIGIDIEIKPFSIDFDEQDKNIETKEL